MKTHWGIAFGVLCGLLAAGVLLLTTRPPRGAMVTLPPPPTPLPLIVQVSGAVANPGVYSLTPGSRVQDALREAGGLLPEAESQTLNLAAILHDGERLIVPFKKVEATSRPAEVNSSTTPSVEINQPSAQTASEGGLININTALQTELDSLPGIGPATAQKIIAYRETNGPFATIEEIMNVSGIGPATFEKIKLLISVGDLP